MRIATLLLNAFALLVFVVALFWATWIAPLKGNMRVTELDRAGVIDEDKLKGIHPELATNLRYNVGMWITESERQTAVLVANIGITITAINILLSFAMLLRRPGKSRPTTLQPTTPLSPPPHPPTLS